MKEQFEATMLRIYFTEVDQWQGEPLHSAIAAKCMELGLKGATVFRGMEGFWGQRAHLSRTQLVVFKIRSGYCNRY